MKRISGLLNTSFGKDIFILAIAFLFCISCTKEYSFEGKLQTRAVSIFTSQVPAGQTLNDQMGGIELGVRFRSTVAGYITGIKFYKTPGNTGTHIGQLYSFDGTVLASATFVNETDSGWQTVNFDAGIPIDANTTYIAAYYSGSGYYTTTNFGFNTAVNNPPLTALADGADGINGLFKYTNTPAFPGLGFQSNNYWVDVVLTVHTTE